MVLPSAMEMQQLPMSDYGLTMQSLIASKIAAYAADIARERPGMRARDVLRLEQAAEARDPGIRVGVQHDDCPTIYLVVSKDLRRDWCHPVTSLRSARDFQFADAIR